jgi:CIC family chloride channel protein
VVTGLGVAGFEWLTREQLLDRLRHQSAAVQIVAPLIGLVLAALVLQTIGRRLARGTSLTPSTADEYVKNFHDQGERLALRPVPSRLLASVATLGLGGAMGFEGPAIYLGASVGSALQRAFSRWFSRADAKLLLACGAAAGVSAIFKAPATGLVFALEVPFQDDIARRMLLPAGIASATSYLAFVAFAGTAPFFAVSGAPPFDLRDLGGSVVLGLLCGVGARLFTGALIRAKHLAAEFPPLVRALSAGAGLTLLAALSFLLFGDGLTVGAGYDNLAWAVDPRHGVGLVLLLLVMRALATVLTVAGGGVGGLFIPLVVEGALMGDVVGGLFRASSAGSSNFFPLVGVSAFLGAGYRVPLAAVVFAAEATGRPGFIVPGLMASVVAQLCMGGRSASPYQRARRAGHLERRLDLPLAAALRTEVATVPSDATLAEFFSQHLLGNRQQAVPVVDGDRYQGIMSLAELRDTPQSRWHDVTVAEAMRTDVPTAAPQAALRDAVAAMEHADVDVLPVTEGRSFVGVVTTSEIVRLDEILDRVDGPR